MDFLIVEGDFPFWRGFVVEQWKRLPHRLFLLTRYPKLWRPADYDAVLDLPLVDGQVDTEALRALAEEHGPFDGATTLFEPAVGVTLEVQRALDLPPLSRLEPRCLRNKAAMVEILEAAGIAVPRTVSGGDLDALAAKAAEHLRFPMITKPAELAGSAGISVVNDPAELRRGLEVAGSETLPFEIDGRGVSVAEVFGCRQQAIAQEYVEGPEYSVEGYASRGDISILAITEKLHSGPPLFEELAHLQPARLSGADWNAILEYGIATAEAFELRNCFFHLEIRLTGDGPVFIEINCRLAGDMIGRLMELRSGMNCGEVLLRLAAGGTVEAPERWVGSAGVRLATVADGGRVKSLRAPLLRNDREFAVFESGPGSSVPPPHGGGRSRIGYYIVAGDQPKAVESRLEQLASETEVTFE